jgi:hypothetical protein
MVTMSRTLSGQSAGDLGAWDGLMLSPLGALARASGQQRDRCVLWASDRAVGTHLVAVSECCNGVYPGVENGALFARDRRKDITNLR